MTTTLLPTISIVTPSLNQRRYLDEAIRSVLDQNYPRLEYVIIDGGSSDGSADLIRGYQAHLTYWCSEPDGGLFDGLNKGFARTTGEVMGWLNSDDKYTPWAFSVVGELFALFPEIEWLSSLFPLVWDREGRAVACVREPGWAAGGFLAGDNLVGEERHVSRWIQQESTFWRRSLWERAGGALDPSMKAAGDFELWCRFSALADHYGVETPLAGFRAHGDQVSERQSAEYLAEARAALARHGGRLSGRLESWLRAAFVRGLPIRLRRPGVRLGLLAPRKACRFLSPAQGWKLVEE